MNKTQLIYGTYRKKEWDRITAIYKEANVEYTEGVHTHTFQVMEEGVPKRYTWYFYHLTSYVTPEEERVIRRKRDRLKKIYF